MSALPEIKLAEVGPTAAGSNPQMLGELLEVLRLEIRLRVAGKVDALQPGLSEIEVRRLLAEVGLTANDELVVLYAWANGHAANVAAVVPGFPFVPLDRAVEEYRFRRELIDDLLNESPDLASSDVDWGSPVGWLPLTTGTYAFVMQATKPSDRLVRFTSPGFGIDRPISQIDSLCTLMAWRIAGLRSGAYHWDTGSGEWIAETEMLSSLQRDYRMT